MDTMEVYRRFLKSTMWEEWKKAETDQKRGLPMPPVQKPLPPGVPRIDLVPPKDFTVGQASLAQLIAQRRSHRKYTEEPLTLEELSFLLWATQGVRSVEADGKVVRRTVPSGGNRHPFETYIALHKVLGLPPGIYRYLPLDHQLAQLSTDPALPPKMMEACNQQPFVREAAAVFVWTVVAYRSEWRYSFIAHKVILLDAGHVCQNLYLASEAVGAGTCGIASYNQTALDALLGIDGEEEFATYVASVGKVPRR